MSFHVIQDERDVYEKYMDHLREQTKLKFAIHGVPDEDQPQIKDALQELLTAEVINLEHENLRGRGVSDEFLTASDHRPTLKELPLPEKERTVLEAKIRRAATQLTARQAGGGSEASAERPPPAQPLVQFSHAWQSPDTMADTCICASTFPGTYNSLLPLIPFPPYPPGRDYVIIACNLAGLPWFNALYLRVEPLYGSPPGRMVVGLASEVQWHREIRAWHLCNETVASVQQPYPSNNPKYMALYKGCYGPHTLMFSDGFWNFSYLDDSQFWSVFDGKRLTFYWVEGPFTLPEWMSALRTIRAKHSGKVLDVEGVSTTNGADIQQYDWLGGDNQRWEFQHVGDGYYRIVAKHSRKVLDVRGVSTANGAQIQQWDWLGGDNQRWKFDRLDDGHYRIVAKHSGKVLDVRGVSTANGARIQQWDWVGGDNQRWKL
jgi:hypothetical protein